MGLPVSSKQLRVCSLVLVYASLHASMRCIFLFETLPFFWNNSFLSSTAVYSQQQSHTVLMPACDSRNTYEYLSTIRSLCICAVGCLMTAALWQSLHAGVWHRRYAFWDLYLVATWVLILRDGFMSVHTLTLTIQTVCTSRQH